MEDASSLDATIVDANDGGMTDSSVLDSGEMDAMLADASMDGGPDAELDASPMDSGSDSGVDSGEDASVSDSGIDSGTPDAGPPRVLVFEFERTLSGGPVRSFWTREDSGSWRNMCSGSSITSPSPNVWRCTYDRIPLVRRGVIRFYADFSGTGTSPSCGFSDCSMVGVHRLYIDGSPVPAIDISEVDSVSPYPPAGMIRVKLYATPP